jgi:hypothetical protein
VQAPEVVPVLPPVALVAACPSGYRAVSTTGDIVKRLTATENALAVCSARVEGLRRWRAEAAGE